MCRSPSSQIQNEPSVGANIHITFEVHVYDVKAAPGLNVLIKLLVHPLTAVEPPDLRLSSHVNKGSCSFTPSFTPLELEACPHLCVQTEVIH